MELLFLLGRVLFGGYFVISGWNHFASFAGLTGYAASKGVPAPKLATIITGSMIFLGGLGILLGIAIQLSVLLIAIFLLGVSFKMHNFWKVSDPMARMSERINFSKNIALLGADILLLFIPLPWPLSLFV